MNSESTVRGAADSLDPVIRLPLRSFCSSFGSGVEALLVGAPVVGCANMYQSYVAAAKAVGSPNKENFTQGLWSAGQQEIRSYDVTNRCWGGKFGNRFIGHPSRAIS